jgi:hypothetical protein
MAVPSTQNSDDDFTPPGILKVSPAALQYAREFVDTVKGRQGRDWVATFDWATSISVKRGPNEPSKDIGACLTLGASERHEIPPGFTQTIDGVEFAIQIPREIWAKSVERLIELDKSLLFKLALR